MDSGASAGKLKMLAMQAFHGVYGEARVEAQLKTFLRRFFAQQFKRNCVPDGPKVGSVSLSPRGDWRMPSDMQGRHVAGISNPSARYTKGRTLH